MDAEDIVQEAFLRAFEKLEQFDESRSSFQTWVGRIAINIALKSMKKTLPHMQLTVNLSAACEEYHNERYPEEERMLAVIAKLPSGYRTVFNLFVLDNFSHREIADKLGICETTSRSQLTKAKRLIRDKLEAERIESNNKLSSSSPI